MEMLSEPSFLINRGRCCDIFCCTPRNPDKVCLYVFDTDGTHLAAAADRVASIRAELAEIFKVALQAAYPHMDVEPYVTATNNPQFGDYQCNNAMALFGRMRGKASYNHLSCDSPWPLCTGLSRLCCAAPL